jgi:hypothetical protein
MLNIGTTGYKDDWINKIYISNDFVNKSMISTITIGCSTMSAAIFANLLSWILPPNQEGFIEISVVALKSTFALSSTLVSFNGDEHQMAAGMFSTGCLATLVSPAIGMSLMGVGLAYELYHNAYDE